MAPRIGLKGLYGDHEEQLGSFAAGYSIRGATFERAADCEPWAEPFRSCRGSVKKKKIYFFFFPSFFSFSN